MLERRETKNGPITCSRYLLFNLWAQFFFSPAIPFNRIRNATIEIWSNILIYRIVSINLRLHMFTSMFMLILPLTCDFFAIENGTKNNLAFCFLFRTHFDEMAKAHQPITYFGIVCLGHFGNTNKCKQSFSNQKFVSIAIKRWIPRITKLETDSFSINLFGPYFNRTQINFCRQHHFVISLAFKTQKASFLRHSVDSI